MATTTPQAGDFIIHKRSETTFALSKGHGPPQILSETYDEALAKAMSLARQGSLDVWYSEDGQSFQRVAQAGLAPPHASLPPTVPAERRNLAARHVLTHRIRGEFEEMPGLSLTMAQAVRLFGLPPEICARVLLHLAEEGLLGVTRDGRYVSARSR